MKNLCIIENNRLPIKFVIYLKEQKLANSRCARASLQISFDFLLCFFVGKTEGNSSLRRFTMPFDIAILNTETFITGAFVCNSVFIGLCASEVSNGNTRLCILRTIKERFTNYCRSKALHLKQKVNTKEQ